MQGKSLTFESMWFENSNFQFYVQHSVGSGNGMILFDSNSFRCPVKEQSGSFTYHTGKHSIDKSVRKITIDFSMKKDNTSFPAINFSLDTTQ